MSLDLLYMENALSIASGYISIRFSSRCSNIALSLLVSIVFILLWSLPQTSYGRDFSLRDEKTSIECFGGCVSGVLRGNTFAKVIFA